MREDEHDRLIAWNRELTAAHQRLRQALRVTRDALGAGDVESGGADLLLYCHGFCAALSGHHISEDAALFPEGLGAIMESHFNYEERQLLDTLSALHLEADPHTFLGPL